MGRTTITIGTPDGRCPASVIRPNGPAKANPPWPAVLLYMDGIGYRPAILEIGERIAAMGYLVLVPDLFYRAGPYVAPEPARLFDDVEFRKEWFAKFASTVNVANAMRDTSTFLDALAAEKDVKPGKIGVTGYCMGGRYSLYAAAHFPDRIAAVGSFHPARLVTDDADSPHLLAAKIKARVYVAGAIEDQGFPDEQKRQFDEALTAAHVDHVVTTYEGARHGWVPQDTPVHNPAAAERHYQALAELFGATLS
jgi:carboxymethylenebutenolidase